MNINEYKEFTRSVIVYPKENEGDYLVSGLASEVGEYFGALAKYHRGDYDYKECRNRIEKELGDILWFWVRTCDYYEFDPNEIINKNVEKLKNRQQKETLKGDGDNR